MSSFNYVPVLTFFLSCFVILLFIFFPFSKKLVDLLKHAQFRALGIKLLYHMSMDEEGNSMFSYTEALPLLMQLIVNWPQRVLAQELGALAVNVSHNSRNAENMCQVGFCEKI